MECIRQAKLTQLEAKRGLEETRNLAKVLAQTTMQALHVAELAEKDVPSAPIHNRKLCMRKGGKYVLDFVLQNVFLSAPTLLIFTFDLLIGSLQ